MENIKNLLGDAYKEGMTLEEVNKALEGKKLVDLSTGEYVSKGKYDTLETKHKNLQAEFDQVKEQTKDFEKIKAENETFKTEKADAELKAKVLKLGIKESAYKYVKGDIIAKELELGDDEKANADSVKKYLESHPEFAVEKPSENPQTPPATITTTITKPENKEGPKEVVVHSWNKNRGL